jgi:hypothetical protein
MAPFRLIEREIHQPVAIIDLYIEHSQRRESLETGHLRAKPMAERPRVKSDDLLVLLPKMPERQRRLTALKPWILVLLSVATLVTSRAASGEIEFVDAPESMINSFVRESLILVGTSRLCPNR